VIPDDSRAGMYRYCLRVSAADGIKAPFTSQTNPVCPTVGFTTIFSRSYCYRLVFADTDVKAFTYEFIVTLGYI